jgi:hypothetical protein
LSITRTATATGKCETDGNLTGNQRRNCEAVALNIEEAVTSGFHIHPLKQSFKQNKGSGTEFSKNHLMSLFQDAAQRYSLFFNFAYPSVFLAHKKLRIKKLCANVNKLNVLVCVYMQNKIFFKSNLAINRTVKKRVDNYIDSMKII